MAAASGPDDVPRVVAELLRRGERSRLRAFRVRGGDPRATVLLDLVARPHRSRASSRWPKPSSRRSGTSPARAQHRFARATLARVAGMVRGAGEAMFAVARTAGWVAHALEAYAGPGPLRPRAVYTGRPARGA